MTMQGSDQGQQTDGAAIPASGVEGNQTPASYTQEQLQQHVASATATTQAALAQAQKTIQALTGERDAATSESAALKAQVASLEKASELGDDAASWAKWRADETTKIAEAQRKLGLQAMEVTRAQIALDYGVPKETLAVATSESEMYRIALDTVNAARAAIVSPAPAVPAPVVGTPPPPAQGQPPVPPAQQNQTPQIDRGGGAAPASAPAGSRQALTESLQAQPGWNTFFDQFPDA